MTVAFMYRILTPILLISLVACGANEGGDFECGTQGLATMGLGRAIGQVRAARLAALTREQERVLDEIESRLARQIEADPDSSAQGAAWMLANRSGIRLIAGTELAQIEELAQIADSTGRGTYEETRSALLDEAYGRFLADAARELDRSPPTECAAERWQSLRDAVLDAATP